MAPFPLGCESSKEEKKHKLFFSRAKFLLEPCGWMQVLVAKGVTSLLHYLAFTTAASNTSISFHFLRPMHYNDERTDIFTFSRV